MMKLQYMVPIIPPLPGDILSQIQLTFSMPNEPTLSYYTFIPEDHIRNQ